MAFRLRYQDYDIALPIGAFLVGRTAECQLELDGDPAVSRRHVVFHVAADEVVVEDLGSRNGIRLNGQRVVGRIRVRPGDKVLVGRQELSLLDAAEGVVPPTPVVVARVALKRIPARTLDVEQVDTKVTNITGSSGEDVAGAKILAGLRSAGSVAEQALLLGKADDFERVLAAPMAEVLRLCRSGRPVYAPLAEHAACFAARLATATGKGSWVDFAIELYATAERPAPAIVIDELTMAIHDVPSADVARIKAYVEGLRQQAPGFGPADRFLFQRLEGLERLATRR